VFSQGSGSQPASGASPFNTAPNNPATVSANAPPANELAALIQNYGGLIVAHLNQGTPGFIFAEWITGLLGTGVHVQITSQGEPALVQALLVLLPR
jgi:hypothetical protein